MIRNGLQKMYTKDDASDISANISLLTGIILKLTKNGKNARYLKGNQVVINFFRSQIFLILHYDCHYLFLLL